METPVLLTVENTGNNLSLQNQSGWRKWIGLAVLTLGLAIVIIDTTLLNVSLASIITDLKTDLQSLQWVITAYALVLAAFTITGGRLGDLYGRKKCLLLGRLFLLSVLSLRQLAIT
jgi:MFS family permease